MTNGCPAANKRAYVLIYLLETRLRKFIVDKLEKKSVTEQSGGWLRYIPHDVLNTCQRRSVANHSSYQNLGSHQLMDYSDLTDLGKICYRNPDAFSEFGNLQVLSVKLKEIDMIRNTVAHNRKLSNSEFGRLRIAYKDIMRFIERS